MSKQRKLKINFSSPSPNPSSSSSVKVSDNTLATTNEELGYTPMGSSSSQTFPNTEEFTKASSTAPIETPKKVIVKKQNPPPKKEKKNEDKGETKPKFELPAYTNPNSEVGLQEGTNTGPYDRASLYSNEVSFDEGDTEVPEEHRTVLQALMGWDDIPMGGKWNHFIQHGFTGMHGKPLQEVLQMAQLEAARGGGGGGKGSFSGNLRARETHRRTIANQWDKLLSEWNSGRYASGDEYTVQEFFREAKRLKQAYADAGYNPNELRNPSINAGGFQQGFQKNLQDDRGKVDWIGGLLSSIQGNVARNPDWLNSQQATVMFDKLSEYALLQLAQSKGAIADAEKVRIQVASMPRKDRLVYDKIMRSFFNASIMNQAYSFASEGDADARELIGVMEDLWGGVEAGESLVDKDGNISEKGRHYIGLATNAYNKLAHKMNYTPIDLPNATESYSDVLDAFDQYMMKNANVDRKMVWDTAMDIYDINRTNYNDKIGKLGLNFGWGHKGHNLDRNFGDYLKLWQERIQPQNEVLGSAGFYARGVPKYPRPAKDDKRGGLGG